MIVGPNDLTEITTNFRTIANYIIGNSDLLQKEGVFRLAADAQIPPQILQEIKGKTEPDLSAYDIVQLIDALKLLLKNKILIDPKDTSIVELRAQLKAVDYNNESSIQAGAKAIDGFVEELYQSSNPNKKKVAEIIHTYIHLAFLASQFETTNKMSRSNLAVTPIAPLFFNNISIADNPMDIMGLSPKMNKVCAEVINFERYAKPYEDPNVRDEREAIDQLVKSLAKLNEKHESGEIDDIVYERMRNTLTGGVSARRRKFVAPPSPPVSDSSSGSSRSDLPLSASSSPSTSPGPATPRHSALLIDPQETAFQRAFSPEKKIKVIVEELKSANLPVNAIAKELYQHANELTAEQQVQLGQYLGDIDNIQMLEHYVSQIDFGNQTIAPAVKSFIENAGFHLPGEAQQIDRVMKAFAKVYVEQSTNKKLNEDQAYMIAFAIIQLNTDQFNPQVKNKMDSKAFFENLKWAFLGPYYKGQPPENIEEIAKEVFDFIVENEIKMKPAASPVPAKAKKSAFSFLKRSKPEQNISEGAVGRVIEMKKPGDKKKPGPGRG